MEWICLGSLLIGVVVVVWGIAAERNERFEKLRFESGLMTPEEEQKYREQQAGLELVREWLPPRWPSRPHEGQKYADLGLAREWWGRDPGSPARQMRDLGIFFILADLADGDWDGSFFFIDGDQP